MEINKDWFLIKEHVKQCFKSNLHVSIASVNQNNEPIVTPIGTLFLNDDQTGFYFEKFSKSLSKNYKKNNKICVLAVNSSKLFWIKALFNGKFHKHPAIKIYGKLGEKRPVTDVDKYALYRRMRYTKLLKGHQYLWNDMNTVRIIHFNRVEIMKLGKMTVQS